MLRISDWASGDEQLNEKVINETLFRTRCCIPCIIQKYNPEENTVEAQPAIRERIVMEDNSIKYIQLPLLINVPVMFPETKLGGVKFPLSKGDEVLVVFSDLAIDNFWEKGTVQNPVEVRRHDLSDGMAIPCCISKKSKTEYGDFLSLKWGNSQIKVFNGQILVTVGDASIQMVSGNITFNDGNGSIWSVANMNGHTHAGAHGETSGPHY